MGRDNLSICSDFLSECRDSPGPSWHVPNQDTGHRAISGGQLLHGVPGVLEHSRGERLALLVNVPSQEHHEKPS